MSIRTFETEEEFDEHCEMIEEINFKHLYMKEDLERLKTKLEYAEKELYDFEQENKEYLIK